MCTQSSLNSPPTKNRIPSGLYEAKAGAYSQKVKITHYTKNNYFK